MVRRPYGRVLSGFVSIAAAAALAAPPAVGATPLPARPRGAPAPPETALPLGPDPACAPAPEDVQALRDRAGRIDCASSSEPGAAASGPPPGQGPAPETGEWTRVESPNGGSAPARISGLTCSEASACWAVGYSDAGLGNAHSLTMRRGEGGWRVVPSPNAPGSRTNYLADVACASSSDCWSVGYVITAAFTVHASIARWDGSSWAPAAEPGGLGDGSVLNDVACASASACWAVGSRAAAPLVVRWDGKTWAAQDGIGSGGALQAVDCVAADDCWAVGSRPVDAAGRQPLAFHWDGASWTAAAAPDGIAADQNVLSDVACVTSTDCWAVGHSFNGVVRRTLVQRWDGSAWSVVPSPIAIGPLETYLSGVSCASATDCWAVGHSNDASTIDQRFVLHWDGTVWAPGELADPLSSEASVLNDVECVAATECWAAGSSEAGSTPRALLARWDGTVWTPVPAPAAPATQSNFLSDVTCISESDCWAVGFYFSGVVARSLTVHWDGSTWAVEPSPNSSPGRNNYLSGVTCVDAADCWAVGSHTQTDGTAGQTLVLRWDGAEWRIVESSPADTSAAQSNNLQSVSCVSASDCWAVGHSKVAHVYQALIRHWDGSAWRPVPAPHKGLPTQSDILYGVSCTSAAHCTAVGAQWTGTAYQTLVESWDGTAWTIAASPNVTPERDNILSGVTCVSASDCWAVGRADASAGEQTLIEHWDGAAWTIADAPASNDFLADVTCNSASDCWAAGRGYGTPGPRPRTHVVHWDGAAWRAVGSPNTSPTESNNLSGIACASAARCWAVGQHWPSDGRPQTLVLGYGPRRRVPTSLAFDASSAPAVQHSDEANLVVQLTGPDGGPVAGAVVEFRLETSEGVSEVNATTDAHGIASAARTFLERPGTYRVTAAFEGAGDLTPSTTETTLVVARDDTVLEVVVVKPKGGDRRLEARLSDLDAPARGIAARTVDFYSGGALIGTAETDARGVAVFVLPPGERGSSRSLDAVFAGDDYWLGSSDRA